MSEADEPYLALRPGLTLRSGSDPLHIPEILVAAFRQWRLAHETKIESKIVVSPTEGVGFEPTVRFPVRLISSQVPSTAQPPFLKARPRNIARK
jgi:hypothetical protein